MDDAQTITALEARIVRLEELTRQQSLAMINMWGLASASVRDRTSGTEESLFDELEDSLNKIVGLFGASDGRRD